MNANILLLASLIVGSGEADVWPAFRAGGASTSAAKDLPVAWSAGQNVAWSVALPGHGQSSPVVWKDRVYVTSVDGANREKGYVLAFEAQSGKKLWSHEFEPTQKAKWSQYISKAAPTPIVDAEGVIAFFEGGDLLAFSHDGKVRWSRSLVKEYGEFQGGHGLASSPTQVGEDLILLIDHSGPSYLLAVDKKSGKNHWKTDRPRRGSWTSPVIAQREGKPEIIVSSNGAVAGYDADSGKLLWEKEGVSGNNVPSPALAEGAILIGATGDRKGGDARAAAASNFCLKLVEKDGQPSYEVAWTAEKATSSFASPLAYRGHAYFVSQAGVVYCLDLVTGAEKYAERIDGTCWASPIGAGDHVYFFGKDGRTTVIKAGSTFEKVASNELPPAREANAEMGRPVVYGAAVADNAIYLRTGSSLTRVSKR